MRNTPIGALMHRAQTHPKSTAFIFHEQVWTYERLAADAQRLAQGLASRAVGPGDRVALHMMNRPEMIVAYYACFLLGAIAAPLRTAFKFAELAPLLQRLKPAVYIGEVGLYENVAPVDVSILAPNRRFVVNKIFEDDRIQPWEALFEGGTNEASSTPQASYQPSVLINTSGTTGQPKFVMHTPDTLSESASLMFRHWELWQDDIVVEPLAMAHMSGLVTFLCYIQFGISFILLESFDADTVLDAMERYGCTRYLGFPAQYAALLERQLARPRNLTSLRLCLTGGDTCPVDLQKQVTSIFSAPLYNLWAATEVVGSLTFGLQDGPVTRIAKGAQVRLIDDRGAEVAVGEVGELLIRGGNVFPGYWNDPEATEESLKAGWYHTGDLMRRGEDDDLWFVSRKKDIIIRGGTNISPVEVEEALVACHHAVEQAAVVGMPDKVLGQRVFAFVKLTEGTAHAVVTDILRRVATRLASYKVPDDLQVVDELPRTTLGKVDRNKLLTMAPTSERAGTLQMRAAARTEAFTKATNTDRETSLEQETAVPTPATGTDGIVSSDLINCDVRDGSAIRLNLLDEVGHQPSWNLPSTKLHRSR
jgi:long-chain acyl-CoA synthetase